MSRGDLAGSAEANDEIQHLADELENLTADDDYMEKQETEGVAGQEAGEAAAAAVPNASEEEEVKEECILFVGDLARGILEAELERAFSSFGKVVSVDIKRDKQTGRNLGYGFVQMGTHQEALDAKAGLHEKEVQGRKVRVGWAQRNTSLFVGDLDDNMTTEQLREVFRKYGPIVDEHSYVKIGKFGRFGFVKYKDRKHAEHARRELNGSKLGENQIRVVWHHTHGIHYFRDNPYGTPAFATGGMGMGMGGMGMYPRHFTVHVQFEMDQTQRLSEAQLHSLFSPFGEVSGVSMPQASAAMMDQQQEGSDPSAKRKGFAFVHFSGTPLGKRCAGEAIRSLQGQQVNGIRLQCAFSKSVRGPRPAPASLAASSFYPSARPGPMRFYDTDPYGRAGVMASGTPGPTTAGSRTSSPLMPPPSTAASPGYMPPPYARGYPSGGARGPPPRGGWHHPAHPMMYPQQVPHGGMSSYPPTGGMETSPYDMYPYPYQQYYQQPAYHHQQHMYGRSPYDYYSGGMQQPPQDMGPGGYGQPGRAANPHQPSPTDAVPASEVEGAEVHYS